MTRLGVVLSVTVLIALGAGVRVSAQYPPPADTAVVSVSNPTPPVDSTVTITWAVPNARACTLAIVSQPGTDARLTVRADVSNPNVGIADLFTGATPGPIVVRISCAQGSSADVTVLVQGPAAYLTSRQGPGVSAPPSQDTGSDGPFGGLSMTAAVVLGGLGLAGIAGVLASGRLHRRERRGG